jgi:site-specific DNA-methyltransferase (adenine-specific)
VSSNAPICACEDTWHWNESAERAFDQVVTGPHSDASTMLKAMRSALGENDMMAYLAMMAVRLIELHRVLKPTGSLFLHCDPVASHYLKILLDSIFGPANFRNEIIWKRTFAHGNVTKRLGDVTDTILYYAKGASPKWNQLFKSLTPEEIEAKYPNRDPSGRRWQSVTLRNPGVRPNLHFPYRANNGVTYQPHPNGWSCNLERLEKYDREGRLHFPSSPKGALRLKMYATKVRASGCNHCGTTFRRLAHKLKSDLVIRLRSPLPCWSASSAWRPMRATLCLIRSAVAARQFTPRKSSVGHGSESTLPTLQSR